MKTGTLKELNVKPGDVVQMPPYPEKTVAGWENGNCYNTEQKFGGSESMSSRGGWNIISRADDTPTLWRDMTPEEKGKLLLARHEGKEIEYSWPTIHGWRYKIIHDQSWRDPIAYRIKPQPKVEVVTLYFGGWGFASAEGPEHATHSITFNKTEGKPDPASIKMEEL